MLDGLATTIGFLRSLFRTEWSSFVYWWEKKIFRRLVQLSIVFALAVWVIALSAPARFPVGSFIKVEEGKSVEEIGNQLKEVGAIRSSFLFKMSVRLFGKDRSAIAGTYLLPRRQSVPAIAWRVVTGDFEIEPVRVTVPEGASTREISQILEKRLPAFDAASFLILAESKEGYLFPDTYFFLPGEEPARVIAAMENNFERQIATVEEERAAFGRSLQEIVTMAALLEEEASDFEDKRLIAGVLWERIDRGMLLQVDAVFPYIMGKNSFTLTRDDLKYDSPYNTYLYKGLPAGPITNPGLDSILAAMTPIESEYLFYLSDYEGNFHFSKTYAQHLRFKAQYIDS